MVVSLKVTFDTNALDGASTPDFFRGSIDYVACLTVYDALLTGKIRGFFGESVAALDMLGREDKVDMVGGARIVSQTRATSPSAITISIGTRWPRTSLHPRAVDRIHGALKLGMRALVGPRRFGDTLALRGFGEDIRSDKPEMFMNVGGLVDNAHVRNCQWAVLCMIIFQDAAAVRFTTLEELWRDSR